MLVGMAMQHYLAHLKDGPNPNADEHETNDELGKPREQLDFNEGAQHYPDESNQDNSRCVPYPPGKTNAQPQQRPLHRQRRDGNEVVGARDDVEQSSEATCQSDVQCCGSRPRSVPSWKVGLLR